MYFPKLFLIKFRYYIASEFYICLGLHKQWSFTLNIYLEMQYFQQDGDVIWPVLDLTSLTCNIHFSALSSFFPGSFNRRFLNRIVVTV